MTREDYLKQNNIKNVNSSVGGYFNRDTYKQYLLDEEERKRKEAEIQRQQQEEAGRQEEQRQASARETYAQRMQNRVTATATSNDNAQNNSNIEISKTTNVAANKALMQKADRIRQAKETNANRKTAALVYIDSQYGQGASDIYNEYIEAKLTGQWNKDKEADLNNRLTEIYVKKLYENDKSGMMSIPAFAEEEYKRAAKKIVNRRTVEDLEKAYSSALSAQKTDEELANSLNESTIRFSPHEPSEDVGFDNKQRIADWQEKYSRIFVKLDSSIQEKLQNLRLSDEQATDKQIIRDELKEKGYKMSDEDVEGLLDWANNNYESSTSTGKFVKSAPVASSLYSVATNLVGGLTAAPEVAAEFIASKFNDNYDADSYEVQSARKKAFANLTETERIRSITSRYLDENTNKVFGANLASFGYNTLMSMADNLAAVSLSGGNESLVLAMMGTNAGTSAAKGVLDNGGTIDQAMAYGTAAGITEVLFEKIPMDNFFNILENGSKSTLKALFKQAAEEGLEEFGTSIVNEFTDFCINGEKSDFMQNFNSFKEQGQSDETAFSNTLKVFGLQLLQDTAGGFVSGGAFGGSAVLGNKVSSISYYNDVGKDIKDFKNLSDLREQGKELGVRGNIKDKSSNYKVGKYYEKVLEKIDDKQKSEFKNDIAKRYNEINDSKNVKGNSKVINTIFDAVIGEDLSNSQKSELRKNSVAKKVLYEIDNVIHYDYSLKTAIDSLDEDSEQDVDKYNMFRNTVSSMNFDNTDSNWVKKSLESFNVLNKTYYSTMAAREAGNLVNKYADEIEQATKELDKENGNTFYSDYIKRMNGKMTSAEEKVMMPFENNMLDNGKKAIRETYGATGSEQNAYDYANAFSAVYEIGRNGGGKNEAYSIAKELSKLTNEQIESAYDAGLSDRKNIVIPKLNAAIRNDNGTIRVREGKVKISDQANEVMQTSFDIMFNFDTVTKLSKILGSDMFILTNEEMREKFGKNKNGAYSPREDAFYFNVDAMDDSDGTKKAFGYILAHEIIHRLQATSPQAYEELRQYVVDEFDRNGKLGVTIDEKIKAYAELGVNLTEEQAIDEIVAQSCSQMLENSKAFEKLCKENRTLAEKIIDAIKDFLEDISKRLKGLYSANELNGENVPAEIRLLKDFETDFAKMQEMFDNAMVESIENSHGEKAVNGSGEVKFTFAGKKSLKSDKTMLQKAEEMLKSGKGSEAIRKETGWFKGYDGKWRYEINDKDITVDFTGKNSRNPDIRRYSELEYKYLMGEATESETEEFNLLSNNLKGVNKSPTKLGDIVSHKALFEAYPELEEIEVVSSYVPNTRTLAAYHPGFKEIFVNNRAKMNKNDLKKSLIHEIQHAIQDIEGLTGGTNIDDAGSFDVYQNTAGEVEARDVSNRIDMTSGERKNIRPDIDRTDVVFTDGRGDSYSIGHTTDNSPVVVVNDNIISNLYDEKDIIQTVKNSLGRFKKVPIKGQNIFFIKDTKNEYLGSKYTRWLKNKNHEVYEDKMKLAGHPQDIIYATTDYINEGLKHSRNDNIVDFARGKILLSISERKYSADVVIGFTKSGICELHDVVNIVPTTFEIKKEATSVETIDSYESNRKDVASLNNTISQNDTDVNTYSMQNSENNSHSDNFSADVDDGNYYDSVKNGNGYSGYSMSNNAVDAYENGEKPISKWTKSEIVNAVADINPDIANAVKLKDVNTLKKHLLNKSSWHHTSSYYNKTDFYSINEDLVENLTEDEIKGWEKESKQEDTYSYRGDFNYLTWQGTRNHPKSVSHNLTDVNIVEKGSFYYVYDDNGNEIVRKKIGSNGTSTVNYDERDAATAKAKERENAYKNNSSNEAYQFFTDLNGKYQQSSSNHIYQYGKKPTSYDYAIGLSNFFEKGEQRLYDDEANRRYVLETWDGEKWVSEKKSSDGVQFSADEDSAEVKKLKLEKSLIKKGMNANSVLNEVKDLISGTKGIDRYDFAQRYAKVVLNFKNKGSTRAEAINSLAEEIVNHLYNKATNDDFDLLKSSLKGESGITIADQDKADVGDWSEFVKRNGRKLNIRKEGGIEVDSLYQELMETLPQYFNEDITHPGDQLKRIAEVYDMLKPQDEYGVDEYYYKDTLESVKQKIRDSFDNVEFYEQTALDKERERFEKALAEEREKGRQKANDVRERFEKALAEEREKGIQKANDVRERMAIQQLKKSIRALRNRMLNALDNPTDKRFVPTELYTSVAEFVKSLDTYTSKPDSIYNMKLDSLLAKLGALEESYKDLMKDTNVQFEDLKNLESLVSSSTLNTIHALKKSLGDKAKKSINAMSYDELVDLYNVARDIYNEVNDSVKIIGGKQTQYIKDIAEQVCKNQIDGQLNHKSKFIKAMNMKFRNQTLNPVRFIDMMCGFDEDAALNKLTDELNKGLIKQYRFAMETDRMFEELTTGKNEKRFYQARNKLRDTKMLDKDGNKIELTDMQILQVLMSWEREQSNSNLRHMETAGVIALKDGSYSEGIEFGITPQFISRLESMCDDYMKEFRKVAHKFFNVKSTQEINAVTRILKHRNVAISRNYIPFVVDKTYVDSDITGLKMNATIDNMGFTHSIAPGASQPLVINGLDNLIERHKNDVAKFVGLAIPIRNFNRVYNSRVDIEGVGNTTAKSLIKKNWSYKDQYRGNEMIEQMLADLQTSRVSERSKVLNKVKNAFVLGALGANPSVVIKQAASYFAAGSEIDSKYLIKASNTFFKVLSSKKRKELFREICDVNPEFYQRLKGLSTTELGDKANSSSVSGDIWDKIKNSSPDKITKMMQIAEKGNFMNWIQAMDVATTASIYIAAKEQVKANNPNLNGKALNDKVAELYSRTLENTQPMYDPLHRPEIQKTTNEIAKSFFMFSTQPLQNAGIIYDAYGKYRAAKESGKGIKAARKKLARAVSSQVVSAIVFSSMTLIASAFLHRMNKYREDDGEDKGLFTASSILSALANDTASVIASDFVALVGGQVYDGVMRVASGNKLNSVELPLIDYINEIIDAVNKLGDDPLKNGIKISEKLLEFFHIPATNLNKMYDGIANHIIDISNGEFGSFNAGYEMPNGEYDVLGSQDADTKYITKEIESIADELDVDAKTLMPSKAEKSISVDGKKIELSRDEYGEYAQAKADYTKELLIRTMKSDVYKRLSAENKKQALSNAKSLATAKAKADISDYTNSSIDDYENAKENGIDEGTYAISKVVTNVKNADTNGSNSVDDMEYRNALEKFNFTDDMINTLIWYRNYKRNK